MVKQNASELANTVFEIQPNKADSFFCFLLFVKSFNCLYLWNQLLNLCGVNFHQSKPKQYPNRKCQNKKKIIFFDFRLILLDRITYDDETEVPHLLEHEKNYDSVLQEVQPNVFCRPTYPEPNTWLLWSHSKKRDFKERKSLCNLDELKGVKKAWKWKTQLGEGS